jgi:ketosteroid isomerase-like protein
MRTMATNERDVRDIIDDWERAVQNRDLAGTVAGHAPDILMFDVPEPIQAKGLDEYRETWELFFRYSKGGAASFRLHELEVTATDTLAAAHALLDAGDDKCRLTMVLQKVEGEWMIVHEHHSSPWPNPR